MRPALRTPEELREWVCSMVEREQASGAFGTLTVHFEEGVITRAQTARYERPPAPAHVRAAKPSVLAKG